MKTTFLKIMWIVICILLIVTGFICILNPQATIASLAYVLGAIVLISGISDVITYFRVHSCVRSSAWIFAEGIFTIVLGFLLIMHEYITVAALPTLFTIWIFISGFERCINSFDIKEWGVSTWWLAFLSGTLMMILGVLSILDPLVAMIAISTFVGCIFIGEGISYLVKGYYIQKAVQIFKEVI